MADTPGAAAASGGLPQLDFSTWPSQIFWLVVTFAILYVILNMVAGPKIARTLEERQDAIAGDLDLAAEYDRKADEAETAYKAALEKARAEARQIADRNKAEIQQQLDAAIAEADGRIAEKAAESKQRLAAIEAEARQSAGTVARETAAAILARFSPTAVDTAALDAGVAREIGKRFGG